MSECYNCPYAIWDYETFYGTSDKQWFVDGCKVDREEAECEEDKEET